MEGFTPGAWLALWGLGPQPWDMRRERASRREQPRMLGRKEKAGEEGAGAAGGPRDRRPQRKGEGDEEAACLENCQSQLPS